MSLSQKHRAIALFAFLAVLCIAGGLILWRQADSRVAWGFGTLIPGILFFGGWLLWPVDDSASNAARASRRLFKTDVRVQLGVGLITGAVVAGALFLTQAIATHDTTQASTAAQQQSQRSELLLKLSLQSNLSSLQLRNQDLTDALLENRKITDADLTGVVLSGAKLDGSDLSRTVLRDARLDPDSQKEAASLRGVRLAGADLSLARIPAGNFSPLPPPAGEDAAAGPPSNAAGFLYANLDLADLQHATLTDANLTDASLLMANLVGTKLVGANLAGASLAGARLCGTDFAGAQGLAQVSQWDGAVYDGSTTWPAGFNPESVPGLLKSSCGSNPKPN